MGQMALNYVHVYPNPVDEDAFYVNLKGYNKEINVRISILDVMGRMVTSQIINTGATGFVELEMQRSKLSPGIYFISAENGMKRIVTKVIIN